MTLGPLPPPNADLATAGKPSFAYAQYLKSLDATVRASKLTSTITVRDFGAIGDGVADDTAAFQAAINAAIAGARALYFPAGTYLITSSLAITTNSILSFLGAGGTSTLIVFTPSVSSNLFNIQSSSGLAGPMYFSDLAFFTASANGNAVFNIFQIQDCIFTRCYINGFVNGAVLSQAFAPLFLGCTVQSCSNSGVAFADNSGNGAMFLGNHFFGNGAGGGGAAIIFNYNHSASGTTGPCIVGNDIEGGNGGINLWKTSAAFICGNDFDHNTAYHWFIPAAGTCTNLTFMGNFFGACASVSISDVQGCRFENNTLFNYSQTWAVTATQIKVGYNNFTGSGSVGSGANTFSTLPGAAAGLEGQTYPVTDSTTAVWGAIITGGGGNHVLAYCDGTNWTVAAK